MGCLDDRPTGRVSLNNRRMNEALLGTWTSSEKLQESHDKLQIGCHIRVLFSESPFVAPPTHSDFFSLFHWTSGN